MEVTRNERSTLLQLLGSDFVTCALCSNFFSDPRCLPCQHTFCRRCLKKHVNNTWVPHRGFSCPSCRAGIDLANPRDVEEVCQVNVYVQRLITALGINQSLSSSDRVAADNKRSPSDLKAASTMIAAAGRQRPQLLSRSDSSSSWINNLEMQASAGNRTAISQKQLLCMVCETRTSIVACHECDCCMCSTCFESHARATGTATHQVNNLPAAAAITYSSADYHLVSSAQPNCLPALLEYEQVASQTAIRTSSTDSSPRSQRCQSSRRPSPTVTKTRPSDSRVSGNAETYQQLNQKPDGNFSAEGAAQADTHWSFVAENEDKLLQKSGGGSQLRKFVSSQHVEISNTSKFKDDKKVADDRDAIKHPLSPKNLGGFQQTSSLTKKSSATCQQHPGEMIISVCIDCRSLLCRLCLEAILLSNSNHKSHFIIQLNIAADIVANK